MTQTLHAQCMDGKILDCYEKGTPFYLYTGGVGL